MTIKTKPVDEYMKMEFEIRGDKLVVKDTMCGNGYTRIGCYENDKFEKFAKTCPDRIKRIVKYEHREHDMMGCNTGGTEIVHSTEKGPCYDHTIGGKCYYELCPHENKPDLKNHKSVLKELAKDIGEYCKDKTRELEQEIKLLKTAENLIKKGKYKME